jgi:GNAT superfamily N-acetyltransferase
VSCPYAIAAHKADPLHGRLLRLLSVTGFPFNLRPRLAEFTAPRPTTWRNQSPWHACGARPRPRHESRPLEVCQCCATGIPGIAVQPVDEGNSESAVRFLIEWLSDGEAEARTYLTGHAEPDGTSLIATNGPDVIGYVAIVWESNYAGFRRRGIPLVHQIAVAGPFRRRGVATLLMDAAEQLACDRGIATLGITVGLFDEYGPAQRFYGRRGYIPDARGACQGQGPLRRGCR